MESMFLWENTPGLCEEIPTLEYYPAKEKKTNATVVICPGGAYAMRAAHEGKGYAEFLNTLGMDAFVCQYRVSPHRFPLPLLDIRRAIRLVRARAVEFGIDPNKIAVMGSSAGGHLAALASTYKAPIAFEDMDEIDTQCCMPNAQILCYPVIHCPDELQVAHVGSFENLLGVGKEEDYPAFSCDDLVSEDTPQAFLWHTAADAGVNVRNSYLYAAALRNHNVSCEMHIFPHGRHGLGLATAEAPHVAQWSHLLENWLTYIGWL